MARVGFEPRTPASKRAKTVLALDHSAAATGMIPDISVQVNLATVVVVKIQGRNV
jgi:hypothetical protein